MSPTNQELCTQSLLVDDDAAVRAMMNQGLERKGMLPIFEVKKEISVWRKP
jgi:hypothetical protein